MVFSVFRYLKKWNDFVERQRVEKRPFRSTGTMTGTVVKIIVQVIEIIRGTMERTPWNVRPVFGRSFVPGVSVALASGKFLKIGGR